MTARLSQSDLNSHMAEFPFQKIVHAWKNTFLYKTKRLYCCFCTNTQYYFILDYRDVGEEM